MLKAKKGQEKPDRGSKLLLPLVQGRGAAIRVVKDVRRRERRNGGRRPPVKRLRGHSGCGLEGVGSSSRAKCPADPGSCPGRGERVVTKKGIYVMCTLRRS